MISIYVLGIVTVLLTLALFRVELKKVSLARKTWNELVEELMPVNTYGITLLALECRDLDGSQVRFERNDVWMMIGGWEGLNRLQANALLLIALADHARIWNSGESLNTVEQMRSDGRAIYRAVRRIRFKRMLSLRNSLSSEARRPAYAYYRMSERLLTLYERSPSRRYEQLAAVVWPHPTVV